MDNQVVLNNGVVMPQLGFGTINQFGDQITDNVAFALTHGYKLIDTANRYGNEVEKIRVAEKKIGFCSACYYCRKSEGVCAKKDDMADILQKMIDADVIVLASPVYFYSIDAQMKALIDRTLARWTEVKNKEFYYIVTCADNDKVSQETTLACFRGYADCVEGAEEKGVIYGTGAYQPGEIKKSPVFAQAYEMGKTVQ